MRGEAFCATQKANPPVARFADADPLFQRGYSDAFLPKNTGAAFPPLKKGGRGDLLCAVASLGMDSRLRGNDEHPQISSRSS